MPADDQELGACLAAARSGDPAAISRLYRIHQPRLLRILRLEVGEAAEDVASQTWLEVVGALGRFEGGPDGFRAFLFTVARRRVIDHRRAAMRRPTEPTAPERLVTSPDVGPAVEALALEALDADAAVALIRRILSPDHAEVVLLRVVAGLSVEEVSVLLGRSPGNVRVQQHRALKRLAEALTAEGGP